MIVHVNAAYQNNVTGFMILNLIVSWMSDVIVGWTSDEYSTLLWKHFSRFRGDATFTFISQFESVSTVCTAVSIDIVLLRHKISLYELKDFWNKNAYASPLTPPPKPMSPAKQIIQTYEFGRMNS